ncbi:abortive infection system antitoxin AbiGi family protein [Planctomyces sp. SH-PL14]|uniref:abortive infection system antitoxin AbiGi family protein n=1 Tax=Planctomyces sp. SH-PL14 TaxID=1632864 RepID=UPI00078D6E13|nr:abortive infection system antitoxin AbiGi family protein [Planctomyces sp. SH-PL14]AMV18211.1 hypothetical protein VT03_10005 [Planctomyces sp. SH-PL14]
MPSDFAVHSDLLVHWTGKDLDNELKYDPIRVREKETPQAVIDSYLHRLESILRHGFWLTPQGGWTTRHGIEIPEATGVCFTELKLSQSRSHAAQYGSLGIAVKRPFLFNRRGRPMLYINTRNEREDILLEACAHDLKDRSLLQFFKPFDKNDNGPMGYDFYDESEWRILAPDTADGREFVDPRNADSPETRHFWESLPKSAQDRCRMLAPVSWLAAIIYPSYAVRNAAQAEGSPIRTLIREVARRNGVERGAMPAEIDLALCAHF